MYFQQIYRFEVDLLRKFAMSLPLEKSCPRETSRMEKSCPRFGIDTDGFRSSFSLVVEIDMARFKNFHD